MEGCDLCKRTILVASDKPESYDVLWKRNGDITDPTISKFDYTLCDDPDLSINYISDNC